MTTHTMSPATTHDKAAIQIIYSRLFSLARQQSDTGMVVFLQTYTAPAWTAVDAEGHVHTRAEQIAAVQRVASGRAAAHWPAASMRRVDTIEVDGPHAVVASEMISVVRGTPRQPKVMRVIGHIDTWLRNRSGWQWTHSQESRPTIVMNSLTERKPKFTRHLSTEQP